MSNLVQPQQDISFDLAQELLLGSTQPLAGTVRNLSECSGWFLHEPVIAQRFSPPFDNSRVDGFAVRMADIDSSGENSLRVVGESQAGHQPRSNDEAAEIAARTTERTCLRISTGAAIPDGYDAVVMQEDTSFDDQSVKLLRSPIVGENIRRRGEDFHQGQLLAQSGSKIDPALIGLGLSAGQPQVSVFPKPQVSIIVTGDEIGSDLETSIIDSSGPSLTAMLAHDSIPATSTTCKDSEEALSAAIHKAAAESEVIVTTGGVSVGPHDHVKECARSCGFEQVFWRANIKPGRPIYFSVKNTTEGRKYFLGLPGNPVSAMVMMQVFGVPLLKRLQGFPASSCLKTLDGLTQHLIENPGKRLEFVRGIASFREGRLTVEALEKRDSHQLTGMATANCLIQVGPNSSIAAGETVPIIPLSYCAFGDLTG